MHVTDRLVRLFRVDQQLRGLTSRLHGAERFLAEQTANIGKIDKQHKDLDAQIKHFSAEAKNSEGEMQRLDEKIAKLREQMDSAQTNREYKAFLTEINTFKAERDAFEAKALEGMQKVEAMKSQLGELTGQRGEREKVQTVAATDRDARASEIKTRVDELKVQREQVVGEFGPHEKGTLELYNRLLQQRGDEAMASVEVHDHKRHEYTCSSCQMSIPIEAVNGLMISGRLTRCVSCQCILFLDEEAGKAVTEPAKREKAPKTPKAPKAPKAKKKAAEEAQASTPE